MNNIHTFLGEIPRWALMWVLAFGVFFAGKAAMLRGSGLRGWRAAAFALGWMGMDTKPFREGAARGATDKMRFPWAALRNTVLGAVLLWGVARHFTHPLAAGWVGMIGLIFVMHFGTFGLIAAGWHALGVWVKQIMRFPIASTSLAEFWGKRWNLAFRDLAHHTVFMPAAHRWGNTRAMLASFAVSGVVHDLIISVPAGAGYGLPTGYFLLQALGLAVERKAKGGTRATRWLRTHAFTVLPVFILFHPPFVERVMVPFFHAIGALP